MIQPFPQAEISLLNGVYRLIFFYPIYLIILKNINKQNKTTEAEYHPNETSFSWLINPFQRLFLLQRPQINSIICPSMDSIVRFRGLIFIFMPFQVPSIVLVWTPFSGSLK